MSKVNLRTRESLTDNFTPKTRFFFNICFYFFLFRIVKNVSSFFGAQVEIKISKSLYVFSLLSSVLECSGSHCAFPRRRYCIECSIRGQDLTPTWTLLMRWNRRQREAPPALRGAAARNAADFTDGVSQTTILSDTVLD